MKNASPLRIVSLIPSATEIVVALGLSPQLVGRSHECDYPPTLSDRPICTAPKFDPSGSSREIHERVSDLLQETLAVYAIKKDVLEGLRPTHILTQSQCDVCAVSLGDVERVVSELTGIDTQVISLQPMTLDQVWQDIQRVAGALGANATPLLTQIRRRLTAYQTRVAGCSRPTVACIEWTDPLMVAGHWMPELIEQAGGRSLFGRTGQPSTLLEWEALMAADPDVIVVVPCGYSLDQTREDVQQTLATHPQWGDLKAVRSGQVLLADGNYYFNRPGPRIIDSLEIMAQMLHPEVAGTSQRHHGWDYYLPAQPSRSPASEELAARLANSLQ
ncbi:MAG: cobalamin-binding protein [Cyanobacteria bacterium P01_A01_bin.135]